MPDPAIRTRLRTETAARHLQLERRLDILDPQLCMSRYRRILAGFLGFYLPIEQGLRALGPVSPEPGIEPPERAALLAADLLAMGMSSRVVQAQPRCTDLPPLGSVEQMAGCLYVLEGAALGGRIIARTLERTLDVGRAHGASFFAGRADTAFRWKRLLGWLEELSQANTDADEIVSSADRTFASLEAWLVTRGATR